MIPSLNLNLDFDISDYHTDPQEEPCKGLFYRGKLNHYVSNGTYCYKETMVPLKRMSCKGCSQCDYLHDDLHEFCNIEKPPIIDKIEHGAIYKLEVTNMSRDWETGYIDDWDLEFVKVKP